MKEYVKELEDYLMIFKMDKKQDIVKEYLAQIETLTYEQIVSIYGKPKLLATKILNDYGIEFEQIKEKKFFTNFWATVNALIDVMSKNNKSSNLKLLVDFLLIIVFIAIFKIPFILVRDIIVNYVNIFQTNISTNIWYVIWDTIYIIFAVILFIKIIQRWFTNITVNVFNKINPNFEKELHSFSLKENTTEKKENKK